MTIYALVILGLTLPLCSGVSQSLCAKVWLPTLYRELGNWVIDRIHKLHVFVTSCLLMSFLFNPMFVAYKYIY